MYASIKIENLGETKLYILPDPKGEENKDFMFIRSENDIDNPYIKVELQNTHFVVKYKHDIAEKEDDLIDILDSVALEVIAAIQRGDDLADVNIDDNIKPYDPELIRVDTTNFSIRQIYDMIESGDLDLHPDFQRNLVWDDFRKSRLIESILLKIPLPMFYFSQDDEGVLSVVDGLQRLSAIREFMDNKLVLRDLEYLDNCNGKTYSTPKDKNGKELNDYGDKIDGKYFRRFNMTQIMVSVIDYKSPAKVKYDIFRRINTGGRPLNAQELRNCLAGNGLRKVLKEMVNLSSFQQATGGSIKDTRMDAQELALRFIYFYRLVKSDKNGIIQYSGNIDDSLDLLVEELGKASYDDLKIYELAFDKAMKGAYRLFGPHAFRKVDRYTNSNTRRSLINKALFASISVVLGLKDECSMMNYRKNGMIHNFGMEMSTNDEYQRYLSYGTNGRLNIIYAFETAYKLLGDIEDETITD